MIRTKGRRSTKSLIHLAILVLLLPITNALDEFELENNTKLILGFDNYFLDSNPLNQWIGYPTNVSFVPAGNSRCKINACIYINNSAVQLTAQRYVTINATNGSTAFYKPMLEDFTICAWAKDEYGTNEIGTNGGATIFGSNSSFRTFNLAVNRTVGYQGIANFKIANTTLFQTFGTSNVSNALSLVCGGRNSTSRWVSVNSSVEGETTMIPFNHNFENQAIIGKILTTFGWNGTIDEVIYFNKSLDTSELSYIYNGGNGRIIGGIAQKHPTQAQSFGSGNIVFNFSITRNFTACNLVINDTIYESFSSQSQNNFSFSENLDDGDYNWYVNCSMLTQQKNSTLRTFFIATPLFINNSLMNNTIHTNGVLNGADTIGGVINITSSSVGGNNLTAFNISVFVKPDFGPEAQCYGTAFETLTGNQSYLLQTFSYNLSLNISLYPAGVYDLLTCANDTISSGVDRRRFRIINGTLNFDTPVQEETTHPFSLAFFTGGLNLNASVNLSYNNTIYQPVFSSDSTFFYANVSVQAPGLTSNSSNVPFFWNYTIFNVLGQPSGNTLQNTTTSLNQSIIASLIIPCNDTLTRTRNYTFLDEATFASINSTLEILVTYRNLAGFERNFTDNRTAVPYYELCLNTAGASVISDVLLLYNTSGYTTRNWISQFEIMSNQTINQSLYLLSSGLETPITFIVFDIDGNRLENILVRARKLNISNNAYFITTTELTDSEGRAVLSLDITDAFYNFEFQQAGVTQLTTKNFKVQQSEYSIVLGMLVTSPLQQLIALRQVSSSITFNNNTNTFTLSWNDPNNVFGELFFVTQSNNGLFNFTKASNSSSGTLTQAVIPANVTYTSKAIVTIDGRNYTLAIEDVDLTQNWRRYGGTGGIIISMFIFLVCVFVGMNRPRIAVFMGGIALIFIGLLGLMPLTYLLLSGIVFIIFIILLVMKERGGI